MIVILHFLISFRSNWEDISNIQDCSHFLTPWAGSKFVQNTRTSLLGFWNWGQTKPFKFNMQNSARFILVSQKQKLKADNFTGRLWPTHLFSFLLVQQNNIIAVDNSPVLLTTGYDQREHRLWTLIGGHRTHTRDDTNQHLISTWI